jgi:hypothetical protein
VSVWLTYTDAAERFGVSAEAVRQLAIRHRWPRRRSNADPHGRVEVEVPSDFEARPRTGVGPPFERPSDTRSTSEVDAWRDRAERAEMAADLDRERADQAEKRADTADADRRAAMVLIDGFAARADRAEAGRDAERSRADVLADEVHVMQAKLATAEAAVDQAQAAARDARDSAETLRRADAERRGRGLVARIRLALRGE